ncbi:MAG TPA: hypothetical protein VNM48_23515 [Chloroflexota bacterium]|nr:hypothetical protein [Chloroflexota bacterium]
MATPTTKLQAPEPPPPDTVTVTLTRVQADSLRKAATYVWAGAVAGSVGGNPRWRALEEAIDALKAAEARP